MQQRNVLGDELIACSMDPLTGYYRSGCCENRGDDPGMHVVCCRVTEDFLAFSAEHGNDLSTPMPQYGFPGLTPGDRWCGGGDRRCSHVSPGRRGTGLSTRAAGGPARTRGTHRRTG